MLPPMVVYKSKNGNFYKTWAGGLEGPIGAVYTANESGYYTLDKFGQWFDEVGEKSRTFTSILGGSKMSAYWVFIL
jgi:hypothetical protein